MMMMSGRAPSAAGRSQTISAMSQPANTALRKVVENGPAIACRLISANAALASASNTCVCAATAAKTQVAAMFAARTRPHSRSTRPRMKVAIVEQRQDRGQGVLGEQLLAPEHDDQEPDGVAEIADELAPGRVRKPALQDALRDEREAHRQPGRDAREEQRMRRPLELAFALGADGLVDQRRVRTALLLDGLALLAGEAGQLRGRAQRTAALWRVPSGFIRRHRHPDPCRFPCRRG